MRSFDPLPSSTPAEEFDDYLAGYRTYIEEGAHMALQDVAHRLAAVDMKEADVQLYVPRIIHLFRELKKDLYVVAIIEDTQTSLTEAATDDRSPITPAFVSMFTNIMLAANVKLKEIHGEALRMSALNEVSSSSNLTCDNGGEDYILDIPPMAALDEA